MNQKPGIIGKKLGFTQFYNEAGDVIRCTVIETPDVTVLGKRTKDKDGYTALVLGFTDAKEKHLSKPQIAAFRRMVRQVEFDVWYTDFMTDRRHADASADGAADAALSAHLGKFPALVGKLAIIFHVCELSTAEQGNTPAPPRPISAQTLRRVLRVIQYLEGHARRIYAADAPVVATVARRLANRIAAGDLTDTFTAQMLQDLYNRVVPTLADAIPLVDAIAPVVTTLAINRTRTASALGRAVGKAAAASAPTR